MIWMLAQSIVVPVPAGPTVAVRASGSGTVRLVSSTMNPRDNWKAVPLERRREIVLIGPTGRKVLVRIIDHE